MRIKQIDGFTFTSKHFTLYFDKENHRLKPDQVTKPYPFVVQDHPELTTKLRLAVRTQWLPETGFFLAAVNLLKMLEANQLEPLITQNEFIDLCDIFTQRYGSKPEFTIREYGTRTNPWRSAKITLKEFKHLKPQRARNVRQAKAKVLKAILKLD